MIHNKITTKEYRGHSIEAYEMSLNGYYTIDIKNPCGEFVWRWELVSDLSMGLMTAVKFIDEKVLTVLEEVAA